jgi:16S rRNA C967 or C1407 C5-methylase (RsmB/RsmF family)/NOL1/NOP2/fmu family ribosome biogenesis protein
MIILPASFENRMNRILGPEFPAFRSSLSADIHHSVRFNPKKVTTIAEPNQVPTCKSGYYLPIRPVYTLDPLFHAGLYYVQESSSMFLEQFLVQSGKKYLRVLDLCAAPGGKSTHLSALLPDEALLVSNEVIHSRAMVLSENLKKWGNPNVIVSCCDPRDFSRLPGYFDLIVVDAPCSGEGLFRRDPAAMEEWSDTNAAHCALRQRRILTDVWPALSEGGMLIYSTCTFNSAENEENISWLIETMQTEAVELKIKEEWNIVTTDASGYPCYRFYPHKVAGEGFFTAAVKKKEEGHFTLPNRNKNTIALAGKNEQATMGKLLKNMPLTLLKFEEAFLAFPTTNMADLELIKSSLRIVHAGIKVGEIKQGTAIPAHELLLSTIANFTHFPSVDLTLEQAISFLKRDNFTLDLNDPGWNLLTYRKHPIGWVKNIGNRFNNGYPKEWRIRMSTAEYTGERLAEEARKFPRIS